MFNKKPVEKFRQYRDPTQEFTNRSLQWGDWYVRHKILLRKIFIITLTVWSVITIPIGLIVWGEYLIIGYARDEQMIASVANTYVSRTATLNQAPKNFIIEKIDTFNSAPDRYDFLVGVHNINTNWAAKLTYVFTFNGGQTEEQTTILLPGEKKLITVLGHEMSREPTGVIFQMIDTQWKRINPHYIADPKAYISHRVSFDTKNFSFTPANKSQGTGANVISFDVTNTSLFSYWQTPFTVIFTDEGTTTGLAPLTISQFKSGETRSIQLTSFADNLQVDGVILEPLINVFDNTVYMPLD